MSDEESPEDGKARLQAERQAREQQKLQQERRRKRSIGLFAGLGTAAVVVVVALVLLGGGGDDKKDAPKPKNLLGGIQQKGTMLGDPKAPVTVVEFVDLQCPFCRDYSLDALPGVIKKYVRTGKVKLDLRVLSFLGDDSVEAGLFASGAAKQNKLWDFAEEFYRNQGQENSGYVDDAFLRKIAGGAGGIDADAAAKLAKGDAATAFLDKADKDAKKYKVQSTPAFVAIKNGKPTNLEIEDLTTQGFSDKIDPLLD